MRYFFEIAYDGRNYNGWQSQKNGLGIQEVVEEALTKIIRDTIRITASGRTDAGVHCKQQFFHADIQSAFDKDFLIQKLNSLLPKDIAINGIVPVRPDASARYDAVERTYRYQITRKKDPFLDGYALYYFKMANVETMNRAAALLTGERDFECFSKVKTDVNHFLCDVKAAFWEERSDMLIFTITANRFLRGMVRAIVGTLLDVGSGKITVKDFQLIVNSKDRKKAGANVAPYGLYLCSVKYPPNIFVND